MQAIEKNRTISGVVWSTVERVSVQGVQFILTIIIARLISPSDYGIIAMSGIFIAIAQSFIDSGFSSALIQKQNRTEADFSTVFYFNIGIGLLVYFILYITSPYIALFYENPVLIPVLRVIGLNLIINSFAVVQRAQLTIISDFKRQAVASLSAVLGSGGLGIYFAYHGYGVWALVLQTLSNSFINTCLLWILAQWHPLLIFSIQSFKTLFSFGSKILLAGLSHTIYNNMYNLIIGKRYSASDLGYFNRAQTIAFFPVNNISCILSRVFYPFICSIQKDDIRLKDAFLRYIRLTSYIVFPIMIGVNVLAYPLVKAVLTEKWIMAVPLLRIMSIAYIGEFIMTANYNLLSSKGKSNYVLKSELIKKTIALLLLLVLTYFSITAICWGILCYTVIDICITSLFVKKACNITLWDVIKALLPNLFLALTMGGVVWLGVIYCPFSPEKILVLGIPGGILYYVLASYLTRNREFYTLLSVLQSYIRKK